LKTSIRRVTLVIAAVALLMGASGVAGQALAGPPAAPAGLISSGSHIDTSCWFCVIEDGHMRCERVVCPESGTLDSVAKVRLGMADELGVQSAMVTLIDGGLPH
jgi:hypothetical protein